MMFCPSKFRIFEFFHPEDDVQPDFDLRIYVFQLGGDISVDIENTMEFFMPRFLSMRIPL